MVLAKVCVNNWAGRRELDCEVVKETKTRYVCRLLSDGLLPRVRCLRSLISANTPASVLDPYRLNLLSFYPGDDRLVLLFPIGRRPRITCRR